MRTPSITAAAMAFVSCAVLLAPTAAGAQSAPPATDIFLAPLRIEAGRVRVGMPVNITHRPGYDNQPSFTPDGGAILFTSVHEDGQADIYRYDLSSRATSRVTSTPESEYSATVMPGGRRFSVIRVERDSTQRLWSFAMDGTDPRLVLSTLKPVGYHAWIDEDNFAAFVLGAPNALVRADIRRGKVDTLARNIGRALAPVRGGFSFVQIDSGAARLRVVDAGTNAMRDVMPLPRGTQDLVWASDDIVIIGAGSKLLQRARADAAWTEIGDFAGNGLTGITRLAVSPDGKWIAIVAMPSS